MDSVPVKANASLQSLCEKQPADAPSPKLHVAGETVPDVPTVLPAATISSSAHELRRIATTHARYLRNASGPLGRSPPQPQLLSNKAHHSPADPNVRISVKLRKTRALNYLCSITVDESHGLISHIQADFADWRDSVLLESIVEPLHQRLLTQGLPVQEVMADTNYSNGVNYALLEAKSITPWIPVFRKYKPETKGFTYDAEASCFTCSAGKALPFRAFDKNQDGGLGKIYRAASQDYRLCPLKSTCTPKVKKLHLIRTAYVAHYR